MVHSEVPYLAPFGRYSTFPPPGRAYTVGISAYFYLGSALGPPTTPKVGT